MINKTFEEFELRKCFAECVHTTVFKWCPHFSIHEQGESCCTGNHMMLESCCIGKLFFMMMVFAEMAGPLMRRVGGYLPSQWNNNEKIQVITCPILLLSGRSDTIVPPEMMDLLKCVATSSKECTLVEFPEQGHNNVSQGEGYLEKIQTFVSSIL